MMALKCDICGGFFNGLTCINSMKVYYHASNVNTKTVFNYDICPECYQAIKKTIDDRKMLRISSEGDAEI